MKYKLIEFKVRNYRSITDIKFRFEKDNLTVICGANNVGKTNFLRALALFFDPELTNFDAERDIPYHISEGSRGAGYRTLLEAKFTQIGTDEKYVIEQIFSERKGIKEVTFKGKKDDKDLSETEIKEFIDKNFRFFFIEAIVNSK